MLEEDMVATSLEALQVEIKPQMDSYVYNFQRIDSNTTQFTAVSNPNRLGQNKSEQNNLKTYIGFTVKKNEVTSMAIVCETNQTKNLSTLAPQINDLGLTCPKGTNLVKPFS